MPELTSRGYPKPLGNEGTNGPGAIGGLAQAINDDIDDNFAPLLSVYSTRWNKTTTQSLTTNTLTTVTFPDAIDGSNPAGAAAAYWTYSAGTITINADGLYRVDAFVEFASSATDRRLVSINKNGTLYTSVSLGADPSSITRISASASIPCLATNTLTVSALQKSGGNLNVSAGYVQVTRTGAIAA